MNVVLVIISILGNLWIIRIFEQSLPVGLISILASAGLILAKRPPHRLFVGLLIILLMVIQFNFSDPTSLTNLTNDQIRIRDMRLREYPPTYVGLFERAIWFPVPYWFEERVETRVFFRLLDNTYQALDPNLFFFANHPRENIGVSEFEKFPYLLLPFFILGVLKSVKKSSYLYKFSFFVPLLLVSFIGLRSSLGPISLFPFIVFNINGGLSSFWRGVSKHRHNRVYVVLFFAFLILVLMQMISYENY